MVKSVGMAKSTILRLWNRFQEARNFKRRLGQGRPRAYTEINDSSLSKENIKC